MEFPVHYAMEKRRPQSGRIRSWLKAGALGGLGGALLYSFISFGFAVTTSDDIGEEGEIRRLEELKN